MVDLRTQFTRLKARAYPSPRRWHPLSLMLIRFLRIHTTEAGIMVFLFVGVLGVLTANIGINWRIYYVPVAFFGLLATSAIPFIFFRPKVKIDRTLPERCAVGSTIQVKARVTHRGRLPAFDLRITELDQYFMIQPSPVSHYLDRLSPGESMDMTYSFTALQRGACDFSGPVALSGFPFGLFCGSRITKSPHRMLIYPRFMPMQDVVLPTGRKYQPGGLELLSDVADAEEFLGNREYRPGDRLSRLDYSAWARLGTPIVHEYQQEYLCRVALILDTHTPYNTPKELRSFEAAVSLSAAMADALSRREYVIDIFAAGPEIFHFQAGRGLAHLDNILDILACIESRTQSPFATLTPALLAAIREISTAILVLVDWDQERDAFAHAISELGVALKVIVVRDGPPTQDPASLSRYGTISTLTPDEVAKGIDRV